MGKALFALFTLALVSILALSSASALDYRYYAVGHGDVSHGYTSSESSTYDKLTTETDTPWGSQSHTTVKRSSTESFQPDYPSYSDFNMYNRPHNYYNNGYDGYSSACYYTVDGCWYNNHNVLTVRYYDPRENPETIFPSNWRYKKAYFYDDYGNDEYGYDYYYSPRYDWHQGIYNWRY